MTLASVAFAALLGLAQDAPREHVETVTESRRTFRIPMGGVLDGTNTLGPAGYIPPVQGFEPMRSARLENAGDVDLVNPWILVNGKHRWRNVQEIVREALESYGDPAAMSERDKARAIWEFQRAHRFHASASDNDENQDPVKMFNVYGYTLCGDDAPVLADLWRTAGLKTRAGYPAGHVLSEVWYDGAWHLLDGDEHILYLLRDNSTIAAEEDVVRDHDLVKRTHTYSILLRDNRRMDEFSASLFVHDGPRGDVHRSHLGHTMAFTLRPGEALEWRWSHLGKHHHYGPGLLDGWGETFLARLRNGAWSYAPPLRRACARQGVHSSGNVAWSADEKERALSPEKPGEPGWAVWEVRSPYAIVGGGLRVSARLEPGDEGSISFSADGQKWTALGPVASGETTVPLDPQFPGKGPALYRYFVKVEFKAAGPGRRTGLDAIAFQNDLQMAALALPSLRIGENVVSYSDETPGAHSARLTWRWVERSGPPLPAAPGGAVAPANGSDPEGTRVRFQWTPVPAPEGLAITDYHFQLSDREDLRWVLSPNFDKLVSISNQGDVKGSSYTLPDVGLLNPGRRYYWRVRAKDSREAWGPWSRVWSFTPQAPGIPVNLRWDARSGREVTLAWDPAAPRGKPARYVVYASNEKGFTASDAEFPVWAGNQKAGGLYPGQEFVTFPANRLAETADPKLRLRPAHAFYRVAAIDEKGQRSGASDVLAAPRPFIFSDPPEQAKPGLPYRYELKTVASIGDVRCRTNGGDLYCAAFWGAEKPAFSIVRAPSWLAIDAATGVLSGVPAAGFRAPAEVVLSAEIPGVGSDQQTYTLRP
jgi:hypothetical protein